jgi:phosphatidylethanolamine/phosphatidyl-N-methylethanolamine N-methyltransferase
MSRIGLFAPIYDHLISPLERAGLARWRRRAWAEVPQTGLGLELGVGTGANFVHHPNGARVVATDISPRMLRRAAANPQRRGAPLAAADAMRLPFADHTFHWVAETLIFCEVPDPVAGLREVRRVLRPAGRLVMLEHVRPPGAWGVAADVATRVSAPLLGEHYNRDPVVSLAAAGLELERREWLWRRLVVLLIARAPGLSEAREEAG